MAGKKKTYDNLYRELQNLKDIHEKEIDGLKKIIEQQDQRIESIERVIDKERQKMVDIHKIEKTTNLDGVASSRPVIRNSKMDTNLLNCKECDKSFTKFSDLEFHIKQKHGEYKKHECEQCGKTFVTTWRLRKHVKIHLYKFTKICRYYRSGEHCSFEELGCKFLHNSSTNVNSDKTDKEVTEEMNDSKISDDNDDSTCALEHFDQLHNVVGDNDADDNAGADSTCELQQCHLLHQGTFLQ